MIEEELVLKTILGVGVRIQRKEIINVNPFLPLKQFYGFREQRIEKKECQKDLLQTALLKSLLGVPLKGDENEKDRKRELLNQEQEEEEEAFNQMESNSLKINQMDWAMKRTEMSKNLAQKQQFDQPIQSNCPSFFPFFLKKKNCNDLN